MLGILKRIMPSNSPLQERCFFLDWKKSSLFGFQEEVCDLLVDSIIKGIKQGDDFPAVPVARSASDPEKFYLARKAYVDYSSGSSIDGGHHRAVAHYIEQHPLKCKVMPEPLKLSSLDEELYYFPIGEVELLYDEPEYISRRKLAKQLGRPYR